LAFIEVQGVSKSFETRSGTRHVLDDINLTIERGEFVSIVGFMGCGKSTFLNIVAGLQPPGTGRVTVGGDIVRGVRQDAAYVFQTYSLLPWLSALDNVQLAVAARFPSWDSTRQIDHARKYLQRVGLGAALQRRPGQLSGGMRQRVAIARAFASEPSILFLDEPFGALDALTRGNLQQELAGLCGSIERPVTTIMITNSVDEALLLSDRIVPMTASPGATMGPSVPVPIPRPRAAAALQHDDSALRVRAHVLECLTDCVDRARSRSSDREPATRRSSPVVDRAPVSLGWWRNRAKADPIESES
jgi:nitrate/nitrite transport system ATP-binding protein